MAPGRSASTKRSLEVAEGQEYICLASELNSSPDPWVVMYANEYLFYRDPK